MQQCNFVNGLNFSSQWMTKSSSNSDDYNSVICLLKIPPDTKVERNSLMEKLYPKLKIFCQERGYEFQVVDMRWGVRDEATDDHMTSELCMREIKECQMLSTGPNFIVCTFDEFVILFLDLVCCLINFTCDNNRWLMGNFLQTFLSQKYGYRPFPPKVEASHFEKMLVCVDSTEDIELLKYWFKKDENCVPAMYVLQPIRTRLIHYADDSNPDSKKKVCQSPVLMCNITVILLSS